jgi:hypothetical protein
MVEPPDTEHDGQSEVTLADVIGGNEFFGRYDRMD